MSSELYGTNVMNHFDLPREIKNIRGTFKYKHFVPNEQVDEKQITNDQLGLGVARFVQLNWKGERKLIRSEGVSDQLIHRENFFFASDLNSGFATVRSDSDGFKEEKQSQILSDTSSGSKLDYLLTQVTANKTTERLEASMATGAAEDRIRIPVLDPSTNRPIQKITVESNDIPPDVDINKSVVYDVIFESNLSVMCQNAFKEIENKCQIVQEEALAKEKARNGQRMLTTLSNAIKRVAYDTDKVTGEPLCKLLHIKAPRDEFNGWNLIGYCISKYRMDQGQPRYMYSRFVTRRIYKDPHVAYGKTYRYDISPVFAKTLSNSDFENKLIILASEESASISVVCKEDKAPEPPRNIRFDYVMNNNIRINWTKPESYVKINGEQYDTRDIKGYQILVRNSIIEPYRLVRYFTFNNTNPRSAAIYSKENITDDYIISSEYDLVDTKGQNKYTPEFYEFNEYVYEIRPNTDYYFAMCSIDAHGNSSPYSAQYRVRRDNVTGKVDIQLICPKGAPKQYPNLLIPGKLVQPSFTSSGYRYMDVHFTPDTPQSVPNMGEPGLNIQLFELETQIDKNIVVTIGTNGKKGE